MDTLLFALTLAAALGCGLIAAMQSINVVVLNRWFLGVFFGTGIICVLLMLASALWWHRANALYLLAGGALYVVGTLWVTIAFNVPRNNALATVSPQEERGAQVWARYVPGWTAWNHVRTVAALAAAALLSLALVHD